jgi:hypothetical protein
MAEVNTKRVLMGAAAGGVVWSALSFALYYFVLNQRYENATASGFLLVEPRDFPPPVFMAVWIALLFVLSYITVSFYAASRATRGAGPGPAILAGAMVGIASGVPISFAVAEWAMFGRGIPFFWAVEMFVGAILAALVGGWLYRD